MAQPLVSSGNRVRLSPLEAAVSSSKDAAKETTASGNNVSANRTSSDAGSTPGTAGLPNGITQQQVEAAQVAAASGDQGAIDWLKTMGIVAGTAGAVAGGYYLNKALSGKRAAKGPNTANFGAKDIALDTATPNASSAVAKRVKPVDLYVDVPAAQPVAGYLPSPKKMLPYEPALSPAKAIKAIGQVF